MNRGAAYWNGKVYVGALDGRLIALDASTGKPVWQTRTFDDSWSYASTGAPRVVKGKIIIGNSGGDMGARGYVGAYDAETGKPLWRFYTVPGDPAKGFENDAMRMAAKTWTGQWWKFGGGGSVWESIVYDPDLDLLYIGTGNGAPWNGHVRSPGGGDNLFVASIIALRPDTGAYVWHYQVVPGDMWDYDADEPLMLADLTIDGQPRKVLMQAPKDGFFYVLDRADGHLISPGTRFRLTGPPGSTSRPAGRSKIPPPAIPTGNRSWCSPAAAAGITGRRWRSAPEPASSISTPRSTPRAMGTIPRASRPSCAAPLSTPRRAGPARPRRPRRPCRWSNHPRRSSPGIPSIKRPYGARRGRAWSMAAFWPPPAIWCSSPAWTGSSPRMTPKTERSFGPPQSRTRAWRRRCPIPPAGSNISPSPWAPAFPAC